MANENNFAPARPSEWDAPPNRIPASDANLNHFGFVPSQPAMADTEFYEWKTRQKQLTGDNTGPRAPDEPCPNRVAWHAGLGSQSNPSPPYPLKP